MSEHDLRPTVFVVMPFGDKRDPVSGIQIDFYGIYEGAFRPAAEEVGLQPPIATGASATVAVH